MEKIQEILEHPYFTKILNALSDGVLISDGEGRVIWLNKACANFSNRPKSFFIGKDVYLLEELGVFKPSVTKMVIEKQASVSTVQTTTGKDSRFIVTGYPIKDDEGKIIFIIAQTKDITEIVQTTNELEETQSLLKRYSQEIMRINYEKQIDSYYFTGQSPAYLSLMQTIDKIALTESTVLLSGETGVGKNVVAQRIHKLSERENGPFVEINCGAIPESLIESELFGYAKGAFTGANKAGKAGLIKMADGGTLFLDEIGELPVHLQAKLLQFLQRKQFLPIGSTEYQTANVRIIAATNLDLLEEVKKGNFRSDLYYRLNVLPIHVPSLRERKDDIVGLLQFNMEKYNRKHKRQCRLSADVMECLQNYDWPGNIRELENLIERLVIIAPEDEIQMRDLPANMRNHDDIDFDLAGLNKGDSLTEVLESVEKTIISKAYAQFKTTRKTAEELGITQSLLMRRLKKYNLTKNEESSFEGQ
ncbi:MAG TPA: PAS domain-containing protein [Bacillus bacterium]|uniref:HTH-type transcriptional regulatory protein TyrR n=1 Tax=Siminovitchia fordii TaxID=254759 RepID=A0ABQ4KCA5_9BACI|nr:sigma 54-interacting transcriptional regulator [Siminovitchia fordii]GIN22730.1 RNA polymerase subunit sigma-54 [Siminovitchia fordii]HBZ11917.1 PAS domain-containing protein [Bacillus sp. (in: firmicutes)]